MGKLFILFLFIVLLWFWIDPHESLPASTKNEQRLQPKTTDQGQDLQHHTAPLIRHKAPIVDIEYMQLEGHELLNQIRSDVGLHTFDYNKRLEAAAQAHAAYIVHNHHTGHHEYEAGMGFTGQTHIERISKQGYHSKYSSENLSTRNLSIANSIEGLFSAIYHRFGFLDPTMDEIGIGIAQDHNDTANTAYVYVMGNKQLNSLCSNPTEKIRGKYWKVCQDPSNIVSDRDYQEAIDTTTIMTPKLIRYPYDNQEDVSPVFYNEEPDPLPGYDVSGFPISVTFNPAHFQNPKVLSFELEDEGGKRVEAKYLDGNNDPNKRLTPLQFALLPLKRLEYDMDYRVTLVYQDGDNKEAIDWQFHTRSFNEPFYRIINPIAHIIIAPQSSNILYFPPEDPHDLLTHIQFSDQLYLAFIDHNTIRITVDEHAPDNFTIKAADREVHVHIDR